MTTPSPKTNRKAYTPIFVYCLPSEKEIISAHAAQQGHPAGPYLRELGTHYDPPTRFPPQTMNRILDRQQTLHKIGQEIQAWAENPASLPPSHLANRLDMIGPHLRDLRHQDFPHLATSLPSPHLPPPQIRRPEGPKRKDHASLKVYCVPDEKKTIQTQAARVGLRTGPFLRALGLGGQPQSPDDYYRLRHLLHLDADLRRLRGLLQLAWSQLGPESPYPPEPLEQVLRDLETTRQSLARRLTSLSEIEQ